jgi:hypothetical protein
MKTLAVILHYNTVECTDALYRQLKPYEDADYELIVLDNGSAPTCLSRYTTHRLARNGYFGGGLNAAIAMVLECPRYDSLLFLNSDLGAAQRLRAFAARAAVRRRPPDDRLPRGRSAADDADRLAHDGELGSAALEIGRMGGPSESAVSASVLGARAPLR